MPIIDDDNSGCALLKGTLVHNSAPSAEELSFIFRSGNWPGWNDSDLLKIQRFNESSEARRISYFHRKEYLSAERVPLVPVHEKLRKLNFDVEKTFKSRKSTRQFSKNPVLLEDLSIILRLANGLKENYIADAPDLGAGKDLAQRTLASGGARFPLETYIIASNIQGLKKSIFHYNIKDFCLEDLNLPPNPAMEAVTGTKEIAPPCLIICTAVLGRTTMKYGLKGIRLAFAEAGHFAQSIWLLATALGLSGTTWIGCNERNFYTSMDINNHQEPFILAFLLGNGLGGPSQK